MFWQAPVLPRAFARQTGCICSFRAIPGRTDRVAGHMRCRHSLTCGASGEAGGTVFWRRTCCGMGRKRVPTYVGHPEDACLGPRPARFDRCSRTAVFGISILEMGQHTLGAIGSPDGERSLVFLVRFHFGSLARGVSYFAPATASAFPNNASLVPRSATLEP
jgi:hypothetical protein